MTLPLILTSEKKKFNQTLGYKLNPLVWTLPIWQIEVKISGKIAWLIGMVYNYSNFSTSEQTFIVHFLKGKLAFYLCCM